MNLKEGTKVSTDLKTILGIVAGVALGVLGYTELTGGLVSLETSRELMQADLLKASDQKPVDQEQLMLLEDLYKTTEKIEIRIENMMHNKVNIQFLQKQMEKSLSDLETLKDKVRANGSHK